MMDYISFSSTQPQYFREQILTDLQQLGEDTAHIDVPTLPIHDSAVHYAVTAMLGPRARPDECRHIHTNDSADPGPWHVDDYCGEPWPVGIKFAILCYFPQDTPPELGPTAIRIDGEEILGGGPAGSCLLMAHTVEHRALANTTGRQRFMLKYLFREGK